MSLGVAIIYNVNGFGLHRTFLLESSHNKIDGRLNLINFCCHRVIV